MIRPAERFNVNIRPTEVAQLGRQPGWGLSMPVLLAAAAIVGAGIGGMIPGGGPLFRSEPAAVQTALDIGLDLAQIEPAAGPAAPPTPVADQGFRLITRAPDGAFYATAELDRVPVTVRLEPDRPDSLLVPNDAARLVPGGVAAASVRVSEMALNGRVAGPVELGVGKADLRTSVLGADFLRDYVVVEVDRDHVRLVAR